MHIHLIEIGNFRKLLSVRVDFAKDKTVFVGANNSGKTSTMTALHRFLVDHRSFSINDLTLCNWKATNDAGEAWEAALAENTALPDPSLADVVPFLDIWLSVASGEFHYVQKLIPFLEWKGGLLGVRLRFEPDDAVALQGEYLTARARSIETLAAVTTVGGADIAVSLWPQSLIDYLDRRMGKHFKVRPYLLDPTKLVDPVDGQAKPQPLSPADEPIDGNPLEGLIQIDEISAQRGFGQTTASRLSRDGNTSGTAPDARGSRKLSTQLRSYYDRHLDPEDTPDASDIQALQALESARKTFDDRLAHCFGRALKELEGLGYPGVTDPKLTISTNIRLQDGLNHPSAVQYVVPSMGGALLRLPEDSNGLGYQNLVSMVFALMSYRDGWMREGKASSGENTSLAAPPPLHLVLVEEPEAHLHAQVQQVFIKHAYDVLRNHRDLRTSPRLTTQLVVSTHSSHVAHASDFSSLRYFRRLPATAASAVPTASVVNLSAVFGAGNQTAKFVSRYLKATHCDLFFADGAVLIEGSAERILVPHFVEERDAYEYLRKCYISWLEIGGSHAHRLQGLIEHLGLSTLIITDLDAKDPTTNGAVPVARGQKQEARNETLRTWTPKVVGVDDLLDLEEEKKAIIYPSNYSVRAAYQLPTSVTFKSVTREALAYTFEDALFYQNTGFFKGRVGVGLAGIFRRCIDEAADFVDLTTRVRKAVKDGDKADFALELLYSEDIDKLAVPAYIDQGLEWLTEQLRRKEDDLVPKAAPTAAAAT
ncbi:AAA family ATPase [Acidocella sp.]|uniref:AAA family ATPase n=1 Tax=Acidocella sp. TaxID=50710 RepID=UPI00261C0AEF|nr:AAA family ATPase [Acidocella sp.]